MSLHDHPSLNPSWLPDDARVTSRALTYLLALLTASGGRSFSATVVDIATHGFFGVGRVTPRSLGILAIEVPAFARYLGWVAWTHSGGFGFDVANPPPKPVVEHILSLALQD